MNLLVFMCSPNGKLLAVASQSGHIAILEPRLDRAGAADRDRERVVARVGGLHKERVSAMCWDTAVWQCCHGVIST